MPELFSKCKIGPVEIRNRIVMPPMVTFLANENGAVSQRQIDYYRERAKGGVGLIIVEAAYVREEDRDFGRIGIEPPRMHVGLGELAEAIQEQGAKAFLQLNHRGKVLDIHRAKGPDEMTEEEIETILEAFSLAALRAQRTGFDGVEIHGANVYLINQFLSPLTNHRRDSYGRTLEGRMKFPVDVLSRVRQRVGEQYPVLFRMVGHQFSPEGITLEEAKITAQRMEEAGASGLHVIASGPAAPYWHTPPMALPRACHAPLAAEIKKVVRIPVIAVGRINDPVLANQLVQEGQADLIAMGRALICDPYLPQKAQEGRPEEIRKCMACMHCRNRIYSLKTIRCAVNAQTGRERDTRISPSPRAKKILVIGGGPGGMEAARVLALRGHRVSLFEQAKELGGQVNLAVIPPHKEELQNILDYLVPQMKTLNIAVSLQKEATREMIEKENPDVVLLAAGSSPLLPEIPGLDRQKVFTPAEVLKGERPLGGKLLVAGGGMVGCEVAEYLAAKGKQVTIVEILPAICSGFEPWTKTLLLQRLSKLDVKVITDSEIVSVQGSKATLRKKGGEETRIDFEGVVMALGGRPNNSLETFLRSSGRAFYTLGDCLQTRDIAAAIHDAFRVAVEI